MSDVLQRIQSEHDYVLEIPQDELTAQQLKVHLYNDFIMGSATNFERKQRRVEALDRIPFVYSDPKFHFTIVDTNPEMIRLLDNPSAEIMMFTITHSPGTATNWNLNLDLLSQEQKQELCDRHQWLHGVMMDCDTHESYLPQPDTTAFLEVPVHTIYRNMGEEGTWEQFLKDHPLKHKEPIKRLAAKHRYHPFTKGDVITSVNIANPPILNLVHHCQVSHSSRLIYNEGRLFDDSEYHYMIFSIPHHFAESYVGSEVADSIQKFHPRLSFMRCSYDYDTLVIGWCRYVVCGDKIFIDELQTDIKKPLLEDELVAKATLNKLEYHILVQSIKTLYDTGYREFCMPTWEQRNTLYAQAPGTHVPKDPYTYIPKRVGFKPQVVDGLHEALDNQALSYLDLRYHYDHTSSGS
ncbi:MAG: hypothetical protein JXR12_05380 [Neptunomonas phycophila]|uniref:hypothetical protein n=1 Tax=Neptunomonas phycophila TaxID=1572645 RepID=UPI003B8CB831